MDSLGEVPLLATSRPTPSEMAARWASSRLPTTATSPGPISLGSAPMSIAMHQIWPETSASASPETSSPSRTRAIAPTVVGASSSDGSRDSRM